MNFELKHKDKDSKARAGTLKLNGIEVQTPVFMPVGTAATVKTVHQRELEEEVGAKLILGNTYHLYLRPGLEVIGETGGLHGFMHWDGLILTDSGGFQVYSLADRRKITEEGAQFRSHIDGSAHMFSPERVIDIERTLGSDIMMAFDECTPYPCEYDYAKNSMEMTHRWLERCIVRYRETEPKYGRTQALFPIVQGSVYRDLRKISAETIGQADMPGCAIGGLSVGEPLDILYDLTEYVCDILPKDKPRYLMGVGTPQDLLQCIERGVDMFDCVLPTRNARHGHIYTREGVINIKNKKWERDFTPINPEPMSFLDRYYTKAYVRHLFQAKEMLGLHIASLQNLIFYLWLVREAREQILQDNYSRWKEEMLPKVMRKL